MREVFTVNDYTGNGSQDALVYRPSDTSNTYPLLSLSHGMSQGGEEGVDFHNGWMMQKIASAGYVVVAHLSCESFYCFTSND